MRSVALIAGQARNAAPQRGIAGIRDVCRSCPQFQARQRIEQADSDTRRQQNERQPAQALQDQNHVSAQVKRQDQARATLRSPKASTTRRSEEHTSELQSLMRISYAVFCLKKKKKHKYAKTHVT